MRVSPSSWPQPVKVGKPYVAGRIEILKGLRERYDAYHRVTIIDQALVAAANRASRCRTPSRLSDCGARRSSASNPAHEARRPSSSADFGDLRP
jgi:ATP-dependent Clp protease ATP-binding subunit ClpC